MRLFLKLLHPDNLLEGTEISRVQLEEIWSLARQYNLVMLLNSRLRRGGVRLSPGATQFLNGQNGLLLSNIAVSVRQETEAGKLLAVFSENGLDAALLKGDAIACRIYGDQNSRLSCDIDILIRERDIYRLDRLLLDFGYQRSDNFPLEFWLERIHHAAYHNAQNGHTVELHWNFGIPTFFSLPSAEIWMDVEEKEGKIFVLSPEMEVVQMLMHHYMHAFREMRTIVDLFWIFHAYDKTIDWRQLTVRLKKIGLLKTLHITLNQLVALWGEECRQMNFFREFQETLSAPASRVVLRYFHFDLLKKEMAHPFLDKVMMRVALDRPSFVFHAFWKSIFPSARLMKSFYADDRNWVLPIYYLKFFGWRIREWLSSRS